MPEDEFRHGGVDISGDASVHAGRDIIGRDLNVHGDYNVQQYILNNQYLDIRSTFAALIKPHTRIDLQQVTNAVTDALRRESPFDIADSSRVVANILSELFARHRPKFEGQAFRHHELLRDLSDHLGGKFLHYRYWQAFGHEVNYTNEFVSEKLNIVKTEVISFPQLHHLWRQLYGDSAAIFGVAWIHGRRKHNNRQSHRFRMVGSNEAIFPGQWQDIQYFLPNYPHIPKEEFQFLMLGIVIDLIYLASAVGEDVRILNTFQDIWQNLFQKEQLPTRTASGNLIR